MFERLKDAYQMLKFIRDNRGAIGPKQVVYLAVAVLLIGILVPIGLQSMESYTPTDPTLLLVWPIVAVIIVIAIALKFL